MELLLLSCWSKYVLIPSNSFYLYAGHSIPSYPIVVVCSLPEYFLFTLPCGSAFCLLSSNVGWKRYNSKTTWWNPLYSRNLDLAEAVPIISTKYSIENSGKLLTFHTLWQFLHKCGEISTLSTPKNHRKWVAWVTLWKKPIYFASNFGSEPKWMHSNFFVWDGQAKETLPELVCNETLLEQVCNACDSQNDCRELGGIKFWKWTYFEFVIVA